MAEQPEEGSWAVGEEKQDLNRYGLTEAFSPLGGRVRSEGMEYNPRDPVQGTGS